MHTYRLTYEDEIRCATGELPHLGLAAVHARALQHVADIVTRDLRTKARAEGGAEAPRSAEHDRSDEHAICRPAPDDRGGAEPASTGKANDENH